MKRYLLAFLISPMLALMLCLVGAALVYLRVFGFLMFFDTASAWLVIPAVVTVILAINGLVLPRRGKEIALIALFAYVLSYVFGGWANLVGRGFFRDETVIQNLIELVVVALFVIRTYIELDQSCKTRVE
jgi:hypothetical protein